jgi:hypothetical protein
MESLVASVYCSERYVHGVARRVARRRCRLTCAARSHKSYADKASNCEPAACEVTSRGRLQTGVGRAVATLARSPTFPNVTLSLLATVEAPRHEHVGGSEGLVPSAIDAGEWSESRPGHFTPTGNLVVKALGYKPEGSGFETLLGEISNLPNLSRHTRPWGSLSL